MEINIRKLFHEVRTPVYSSDGANCFDIFTPFSGRINSFDSVVVNTGVAFDIPADYCLLLFSRSGHGFKNDVRLSNCVGVVDSDFTGPVQVKLRNDSKQVFWFEEGDRIAQGLLVLTPKIKFREVDFFDKQTERGENGFGSTGN